MQPNLAILSIGIFELLYYGGALGIFLYGVLYGHRAWIETISYSICMSEPSIPFYFLAGLGKIHGHSPERVVFAVYLVFILLTACFFLKKKRWAWRVVLFQHGVRIFVFAFYIILFFLVPAFMSGDTAWKEFSVALTYTLLFFAPSFIIFNVLRNSQVRSEFGGELYEAGA